MKRKESKSCDLLGPLELCVANVRGVFRHPAAQTSRELLAGHAAGWWKGPVELNRCARAAAPYGVCIPRSGRKAMNTMGWQGMGGVGWRRCCAAWVQNVVTRPVGAQDKPIHGADGGVTRRTVVDGRRGSGGAVGVGHEVSCGWGGRSSTMRRGAPHRGRAV